ncbi:amidohydrolase [Thaumasiovibrio sp. DFM-14]|uniref:amidohydrolase n=1 Tax=Thaumasiovibrio sp. DFM-14 TaxID=3384792 RepID=UPI0039A26A9D
MKYSTKSNLIALAVAMGLSLPVAANTTHKLIDADTPRLQEIYKDIHANPELGFMEHRTAGIVANELKELGFEVTTGIGITGVAAVLENGPGPVVMYRADMDANAVKEETGLPYASNVKVTNLDGNETYVSHMCGHDAHTTWLLGMAKTMTETRSEWSGTLVLIAQPAEEPIEGAHAMVKDGLYDVHGIPKPDHFLAMHTVPFPTGTMLIQPGRIMTGSEHIDITFRGIGGHGSAPQFTNDPVLMAGQAITQLQTVVSRYTDPQETAILTIGAVNAGVDNNVITEEATLKLKLHFSTPEVHEDMVKAIKRISNAIALANGVEEDNMPLFKHKGYATAVVNDPELTNRIADVMKEKDYITKVIPGFTSAGSEDAATLVEGIPGVKVSYVYMGTAEHDLFEEARLRGEFVPFAPHNPDYRVDIESINLGAKAATDIVMDIMGN